MTGTWEVKYRNIITDYLGNVWRTDLLYYLYSGPIIEVGASNPPIEMNHLGEGDMEEGIKPKEWILSWNNTTNFQYLELFTGTTRDFKMKMYKDDVLVGSGWVDPDNYSEEFACPIYPSKIHVHDGLGELKNISMEFPSNPTGASLRSVMSYVQAALEQTGLELPIYVATDFIFEKENGDQVLSQILGNIYIDWRVFRTGANTFMTYYDILTNILSGLEGVRLFQEAGAWWIERVGTHKTAEYDVDKYYTGGEFEAAVKKTALMPLTSNSVALPLRFGSDAELTIIPGWKKFAINQDSEIRPSILPSFNFEGSIYFDEWRTETDLWHWSQLNVSARKGESDSIHLPGFMIDPLYYDKFIQSETIQIDQATLYEIQRSWGQKNVMMKLLVDYKVLAEDFDADLDTFKLYFGVYIETSAGLTYAAFNWSTYAMMSSVVGLTPFLITTDPVLNKWSTYEVDIYKYGAGWTASTDTYWNVYVKIFPCWSSLNTGTQDTGLLISKIQLGWYDTQNPDGKRIINEVIEEKNRLVPSPREVKFGSTPGIFGTGAVKIGQEYTDKYIFQDADGNPIVKWGTKAAGIMGDLIDTVMKLSLSSKHIRPLFKLRGTVRDNPDTMDYCTVLQDYDLRTYIPSGMARSVGSNEVQAEWLQVRIAEQETGGEFNWDFNNDFNIGT